MTEGTVVSWLVPPGAAVQSGQVVVAIETEKAEYEVEAAADGVLSAPVVNVNETAEVGAVLAYILSPAEEVGAGAKEQIRRPPQPIASPAARPQQQRPSASPRARRLAAERGVDLSTVQGTGPGGLVVEADIDRSGGSATGPKAPESGARRNVRERRRLGAIQRTSARRLTEAWKVPHIVQMIDADVSEIQALRRQWKQDARETSLITFNDFVIKAAALALAEHQDLNASVDADDLILFSDINAGMAVETPRGLLVPVITHADRRSLLEIAREARRLAEKARTRGLNASEFSGGTFTVSNLGPFGIRAGTPILNTPEAVVVFVGAVEDRPVVRDGAVVVRPMVTLSIGYDHRVADGASAARLTGRIRDLLEDPRSYTG